MYANINPSIKVTMKFTVYSKNGCPYCDKIKKILEISNQNYTIKILNEDFTIEDYMTKFSSKTPFPQVILHDSVGETRLGGCIQTVKFLKEKNVIS